MDLKLIKCIFVGDIDDGKTSLIRNRRQGVGRLRGNWRLGSTVASDCWDWGTALHVVCLWVLMTQAGVWRTDGRSGRRRNS